MLKISAIASITKNRGLGKGGQLLYPISDDLKRFKALTTGHPIIMGRKTFESIGRPLPNRTNIIVTRDANFKAEGCVVMHSLEDAFTEAKKTENQEIFVIGGGQIYNEAMPTLNKLYLTVIDAPGEDADTFFPDYSGFKQIAAEDRQTPEGLKYKWVDLEK